MSDDDEIERCPCGLPLHYPNAATEAFIRDQIAKHGPTIEVRTPAGLFAVPRHYIALHGLRAWELPELAVRYHFTRVDGHAH
jgi:hypothetical protein